MSRPIHISSDTTFALYRLPDAKDHFLVRQRNSGYAQLKQHSFDQEGFAFHPFAVSTDCPAVFIKGDRQIRNAVIDFKSDHQKKLTVVDKATYLKKVDQFIKATKNDFQKLVLSRIKILDIASGNLFHLFEALKKAHPSAFVYLVNIAGIGCWIGATPERLFSQNGIAETMALAGTQRDLGLPLESVQWGKKEVEEQAIVERYFQKILEARKVLFIKSPRHTIKAGNVLHLCTNFQFTPVEDANALVNDLHPSPAVCGMPKQVAQQFIQTNEQHDRAYYCGFLGPVNISHNTHLFVNLRCMQVLKNHFALYVGGGILPDSDPEKEWQETEMKAKTLSNVIEKVYLTEQFAPA